MRDPNRLDSFYETLTDIHKRSFPDWRFGQFMFNFIGWLQSEKKNDGFYYEENRMIKCIKEYANTNSPYYREW